MFVPLVLALCAATAAFGQIPGTGHRFELTPTVSYRFGGELDGRDLAFGNTDVEAEDSVAYGITFDIPLSRFMQLELLAHRQSTDLGFDEDRALVMKAAAPIFLNGRMTGSTTTAKARARMKTEASTPLPLNNCRNTRSRPALAGMSNRTLSGMVNRWGCS